MTNARDKANIPVLNFQSKGIDDNSTATAITIDSADEVKIGTTTDSWSGANGLVIKEASGDGGMTIVSASTSNNGNIGFADTQSGGFSDMRGLITYLHNGDSFRFMTANAERMRLNSTGLGIGTSAPTSLLSLEANSPDIMFTDTSGGTDSKKWRVFGLDSDFRIGCRNDANNSGQTALQISRSGATITDQRFSTGGSERLRIDSSGSVGISNTTPGDFNSQARNLVIGGGSGDTGMTIYSGSSSGDTGNIFFADGSSGSDQVRGGITYNHGDNSMNFRTNDGANRIYISSAGNVGINTSSPSEKLEVNGTVKATAFEGNGSALTGISGGKVLQVVSASKNDTFTTTSTSFVDVTGLTANITPSSSSNKVLVTVLLGRLATDDGGGIGAELNRGGSSIYDLAQGNLADCFGTGGGGGMTNNNRKNDVSFIQFLDSPSSTSALTYKIRVKRASAGSGYINRWGLNDDQGAVSSITLMEIAV